MKKLPATLLAAVIAFNANAATVSWKVDGNTFITIDYFQEEFSAFTQASIYLILASENQRIIEELTAGTFSASTAGVLDGYVLSGFPLPIETYTTTHPDIPEGEDVDVSVLCVFELTSEGREIYESLGIPDAKAIWMMFPNPNGEDGEDGWINGWFTINSNNGIEDLHTWVNAIGGAIPVPEPVGPLLFILGASFFAIRRKQQ